MEKTKFIKVSLIISFIALLLSVISILFYLKTDSKQTEEEKRLDVFSIDSKSLPEDYKIAYINLDKLLLEYKLAVKLNEELITEQARARANLQREMQQFERDYKSFMEKAQLGSFLSQASMESQQQDLIEKQQRLERLDHELTQNLMRKQEKMNSELYDTIMNFMEEFNKNKYSLVLGNAGGYTVLYAEPDMDITREVIDALNDRYDRRRGKDKR